MSQTIAISSWTFNRAFKAGVLDWPGFFATVRAYGLDQVELNNHFFASLETEELDRIDAARRHYGITAINLAIDDKPDFPYATAAERERFAGKQLGGGLASDDDELRAACVERTARWLEIARRLGCDTVRNNTGGPVDHLDQAAVARCADSFRQLCDRAAEHGQRMCIENHGGISSNVDALDALFAQVDRPNLVQALDFGNWPGERRYESVERSVTRAAMIHPKTHDFDPQGEQPEWDSYRMAHAVMRSGFEGPWVIEFEGRTGDTFEGVGLSIALIRRCWGA